MEKLHPGAKWIFRISSYWVLLFLSLMIGWIAVPLIIILFSAIAGTPSIFVIILSFIVYLALMIIIGEIYARMSYNRWFYEFTPTNLKIEKGIIWKRYSNIPYERIQNVDIHRGILARMLGYSSLNVQTAGYSGGYSYRGFGGGGMSEGHIPAVSVNAAEKIRDFLMKKIGKRSGV